MLHKPIPCIDSSQLLLPQELVVAVLHQCGHFRFARAAHYWLPFRTRYWWKTGRTLPTLHWFYCCLGDDRMSDVVSMEKRMDRRIRKVRFSVRKMWREEHKGKLIIENKGEDKQKSKKEKRCSTYRCNNA